ncbi:hypothetical protein M409DRAFT_17738 [Zasmidium cellare ATCC 36951]|uniref:Phosphoinositide phospholipase C n=1 Tax=Zasmidium cellare ATCC 36951 TaxID=1080233 RepID=A0A6A6CZC3_ZASCE|nr:uncharacterized protein M409DRAFT_17738 [Zasmidium cellare ATCC 36951]KAF2172504.1 hypothetical protein M409DRAFT_17738 [Zasmidium cellare ATCC 36951]
MDTKPGLTDRVKHYAKQAFEQDPKGYQSFEKYLENLQKPESSAALPLEADTSHPLAHYFISSSHNTYLSGNQLWGKSTADSYKNVLKRACRCIEIDLWDGGSPSSSEAEEASNTEDRDVKNLGGLLKKGLSRLRSRSNPQRADTDLATADDKLMPTPWRTNSSRDEPVVYHGYTATKEMPFRKVCEAVRDYAFSRSDLPLIVSLEVHCHPPQQEIVVELINDYWGAYLQRMPKDFSDSTPMPTLESLKNTILVKVKYSTPEKAKAKADPNKSPSKNGNDKDSSGDEDAAEAVKKGKIIESLSNLGVFTRAFHFDSFDQEAAAIPTHVFSLGESKLLEACEKQPKKLFEHNLHHLMRAYPKGSRLRSSNLDPVPFWRFGIQMVALNFQTMNAAMMLNAAQFEGTGGWVLKPKGYLPVEGQQPAPNRIALDVKVRLLAAQGLGREDDIPSVYVKCELHVESKAEAEDGQIPRGGKNKGGEYKRRSTLRHSRDPDFGGDCLEFSGVQQVVPELSFLRFKVMDDALAQKDRLLGWAAYRIDRLPRGQVLVHLRGEDSKVNGGKLLLDIQVKTA